MRAVVVLFFGFALMAQTVGGLRWTPPAGWKSEGTAPMRAATYKVAPAQGDSDPPECTSYFVAPCEGGGVQASLDLWKGQVVGTDGKPAAAKIQKRTVRGL